MNYKLNYMCLKRGVSLILGHGVVRLSLLAKWLALERPLWGSLTMARGSSQ